MSSQDLYMNVEPLDIAYMVAEPTASDTLVQKVARIVCTIMSSPLYDGSHDWTHIERVVAFTERILADEQDLRPEVQYDHRLITLAALLHDIGDRKYRDRMEGPNRSKEIVDHVSGKLEGRNPAAIQEVLRQHPELGVVQDADRLDAIGAVGITRCHAYGGAAGKTLYGQQEIYDHAIQPSRVALMKTETGRRLAEVKARAGRLIAEAFEAELSMTPEVIPRTGRESK